MWFSLDCLANWSSILGFIVGVITVILADSVRKAVKRSQSISVFNTLGDERIKEIGKRNMDLSSIIEKKDKKEIKTKLSSLKTEIDIISRSVPRDYQKDCKDIIHLIHKSYKKQYIEGESLFEWRSITQDELWLIYNRVNDLVDKLNSIKQERSIVS